MVSNNQNLFLKKQLEQLCTEDSNQYCFDCDKKPALWTSWSNGVFLCLDCSGEHRGLGTTVSNVRSVTLDSWNESQVSLMRIGGNKRLKEFLLSQNIQRYLPKKQLYGSKIMTFYRKMLKAESCSEIFMEKPPDRKQMLDPGQEDNFDNGLLIPKISYPSPLYTAVNPTYKNDQRFCSISSEPIQKFEDSLEIQKNSSENENETNQSGVSSYLQTFFSKTKVIACAVKDNLSSVALGKKTFEVLKITGSHVFEKGGEYFSSEQMKSLASKAGNGITYLKEKFSKNETIEEPKEEYLKLEENNIETLIDRDNDYKY